MLELRGDLFDLSSYESHPDNQSVDWQPDAIVITTNGFVKKSGECVMGRGCAKQATSLYPRIAKTLGTLIRNKGNHVHLIKEDPNILSFPVKPVSVSCLASKKNVVRHMQNRFKPGQQVPGWACVADLQLIERSANELVDITNKYGWEKVILPRPGVGFGELKWSDVCPILNKVLDNRFYSITF